MHTSKIQEEIGALLESADALALSTVNSEGWPAAGHAPFLAEGDALYIFVSTLAEHGRNLARDPRCAALIVDKTGGNAYARRRLSYRCRAVAVPREAPEWDTLIDRFQEGFGKTVELLRELGDFSLYRLEVVAGRYVRGFGDAWLLGDLRGERLQANRPVRN